MTVSMKVYNKYSCFDESQWGAYSTLWKSFVKTNKR